MASLHFVDSNGNYLGSFSGPNGADTYWNGASWVPPPSGVTAVPSTPAYVGQIWQNGTWVDTPTSLANKAAAAQAAANAAINQIFAQGIVVTSASTPSLNGTWGFLASDQVNIMGLQVDVLSGGTFPINYVDSTGSVRSLSAAQCTALAAAGKTYNTAVLNWTAGGQSGSAPSNAVTIP